MNFTKKLKKKSRKKRAELLMEAAQEVFNGYSCIIIRRIFEYDDEEVVKYAKTMGIDPVFSAFAGEEYFQYSSEQKRLTRELAILMYRQAVLAKRELT